MGGCGRDANGQPVRRSLGNRIGPDVAARTALVVDDDRAQRIAHALCQGACRHVNRPARAYGTMIRMGCPVSCAKTMGDEGCCDSSSGDEEVSAVHGYIVAKSEQPQKEASTERCGRPSNPIGKHLNLEVDESLVVPKQPGIHPCTNGRARQPSNLRAVFVGFGGEGIREELFCRKTRCAV